MLNIGQNLKIKNLTQKYMVQWQIDNKEAQQIKKKEHYEKNKDHLLSKKREKITCECGARCFETKFITT